MPENHATPSTLGRLAEFLIQDPSNLRLRRETISQAMKAAKWDHAIDLAETGLLAHPDDLELLAMQGLAFLRSARYEEAEAVLDKAVSSDKATGAIRFNLACALFMQSRFSEALDRLGPPHLAADCPELDMMRARCLHRQHRLAEAVKACETFLDREPADIEARGLLALMYAEAHRAQEARALAESALDDDAAQLEALLAIATIEQAAGNRPAARVWFERLVREHPDCGRGWLGLATEFAFEHDLQSAVNASAKATKYLEGHIGTWHTLGWLSMIGSDLVTAQKAFDKAMALDRNFAETHGALAAIAALRGNIQEAEDGIRRAMRLDPFAFSVYYARFVMALQAGDRDGARAQLDAFLQLPSNGRDSTFREALVGHLQMLNEAGYPV